MKSKQDKLNEWCKTGVFIYRLSYSTVRHRECNTIHVLSLLHTCYSCFYVFINMSTDVYVDFVRLLPWWAILLKALRRLVSMQLKPFHPILFLPPDCDVNPNKQVAVLWQCRNL